jgi:hypothetical protein
MSNWEKYTNSKSNIAVVTIYFLGLLMFSAITDLIPGVYLKSAYAQSTHTVAITPDSGRNMSKRVINRVGTEFSDRNSVSIKSTDAGIIPGYQQIPECFNCGVVDIVGQSGGLGVISGGIIGGAIGSKLIRRDLRQYYPTGNAHDGHRHRGGSVDNTSYYDVGVTMGDEAHTVIKRQAVPSFYRGDGVKLENGVLVIPDR